MARGSCLTIGSPSSSPARDPTSPYRSRHAGSFAAHITERAELHGELRVIALAMHETWVVPPSPVQSDPNSAPIVQSLSRSFANDSAVLSRVEDGPYAPLSPCVPTAAAPRLLHAAAVRVRAAGDRPSIQRPALTCLRARLRCRRGRLRAVDRRVTPAGRANEKGT